MALLLEDFLEIILKIVLESLKVKKLTMIKILIYLSQFCLLYSFAKDHNLSITDIAINFTLSNKKISKVIFGIRTIEQLKLIYDSIKLNSNKKINYQELILEIDKITKSKNIKMLGNFMISLLIY